MSSFQKIYVYGQDYFINSLREHKEFFKLEFDKIDSFKKSQNDFKLNEVFIVNEKSLNSFENGKFLEKFKNNILIISLPIKIVDLKKKIDGLISKLEFQSNSFIKTGNYILDKNEKSLKLKDKKIFLTEKEIQLIETLTKSDVPISKESIQKQVWFYSDEADTHTVETHIYRLRKKINEAFLDNKFIKNKKQGYMI